MNPRYSRCAIFVALLALSCAPATREAQAVNLTGAGATFPYPLYSKWFDEYAKTHPGTRRVIGAGGGMKNRFLVRVLAGLLHPMRLERSEEHGVPGPAREALAFALLGYFTWNGVPGSLPSVTGARRAAVLGSLTPGR